MLAANGQHLLRLASGPALAPHHPDLPLIRYVDDLLLLCRTEDEAKAAYPALASRRRLGNTT